MFVPDCFSLVIGGEDDTSVFETAHKKVSQRLRYIRRPYQIDYRGQSFEHLVAGFAEF